jgi:hypothetical protein
MGGGTGTGPKSLEEKAIEIEIGGKPTKVVSVEGLVESVSGYNKPIEISPTTAKTVIGKSISSLKFKGTSPVRTMDIIRAGLILDKDFERVRIGDILYLGILKQDRSFGRIDYIDGYTPTQQDIERLGLL